MIMEKRIVFLIIFFGAFLTIYGQGCNPLSKDVSFESSDRKFGDSEVLFKGRTFEKVLFFFEEYRLKSGNTDVVLYRTTKTPILYNHDDLKWKVPYRAPSPHIAGRYYLAPEFKGIADIGATEEERRIIKARVKKYIKRLKEK